MRWQKRERWGPGGGREKGQSIVEMVFIVPILLLILAIVIDAARAFDAYIVLTDAAREGARFASLEPAPTEAQIETMVVEGVQGSGTNITHMVDFGADDVELQTGTTAVTVTVSYEFPLWFGGLVGIDTFHLQKSVVMPRGVF